MKYVLFWVFLSINFKLLAINDSLLLVLDHKIEERLVYFQQKEQKLNLLKAFLSDPENRNNLSFKYELYEKLFEEYKVFKYDSAFHYARKMVATAHVMEEPVYLNSAKIKMAFTLLSSGMFKETLDTLQSIEVDQLQKEQKAEFYQVIIRTYYDLADYVGNDPFRTDYNQLGNRFLKEAQSFLEEDSPEYLSLMGLFYLRNQDMDLAKKAYEQLFANFNINKDKYAGEMASLSFIHRNGGEVEKGNTLLIESAIRDIEESTKETVALRDLAEILYQQGDLDRAKNYINIAMDDAYFYGARHRKIQISEILPIIEEAHSKTVEEQRKFLLQYAIVATLLAVFVISFLVIIIIQFRKLRSAKAKLDESNDEFRKVNAKLIEVNKIKEEYIGHFFNTTSDHIKKVEKFTMGINRKLSARKFDDIKDIVNNINPNKERAQLYKSFDDTFLKIFPDFIKKFNSLFKESDQFVVKENEPLSVELRIFALIRLGINDNEKIAKILNYSVNTVYAYKTKIRNKSVVANADFDNKLMEIKAI